MPCIPLRVPLQIFLFGSVQIVRIADLAHGFVGADLAAICKEAGLYVLGRRIKESLEGTGISPLLLIHCLFLFCPLS